MVKGAKYLAGGPRLHIIVATVPVKCKLTVTRNSILDPRVSRIEDRVSSSEYRVSSIENRVSSIEHRVSSFERRKQRTYRSINCSNQIKKLCFTY